MRFIDSSHPEGSPTPVVGSRGCFVGDTFKSFDSFRVASYVRLSSTGDEWVLSRVDSASTYLGTSACNGFEIYSVSSLPSSVENGALVTASAALVVALLCCGVWLCLRPLFPSSLFRQRARRW